MKSVDNICSKQVLVNAVCTASDLINPKLIRLVVASLPLLLGLLVLPATVVAQDQDDEAGFQSLLNGKDLSGWNVLPTPEDKRKMLAQRAKTGGKGPVWTIVDKKVLLDNKTQTDDGRFVAKDGMLVVMAPPEKRRIQTLFTQAEFPGDFVLKVEFRASENADSGVFIRGKQLQCRDYLRAGPYKKLKQFNVGGWNQLEIQVKGRLAQCFCNGEQLEKDFVLPETGPIGVEGDRGQLEYRNFRIRKMSTMSVPKRQAEMSLPTKDGGKIDYLLYLPKGYSANSDQKYPLMLFLHGRGESEGPLARVASWGPPKFVARGDQLPFILVSPQCPAETEWESKQMVAKLFQLLDHAEKTWHVDSQRIMLTGLSMGGSGTWRLAAEQPHRFAAIAPVCGVGKPGDSEVLKTMPTWVFHGSEDAAVPIAESVQIVDAIKKAGGESIRFTVLEHVGHNSWSAAYATPELFEWMLKQRSVRHQQPKQKH